MTLRHNLLLLTVILLATIGVALMVRGLADWVIFGAGMATYGLALELGKMWETWT